MKFLLQTHIRPIFPLLTPLPPLEAHVEVRAPPLRVGVCGRLRPRGEGEVAVEGESFLPVGVGAPELPHQLAELARVATDSGGGKFPILPFPGEISYRCFEGVQKYF